MSTYHIQLPLTEDKVEHLRAGDVVTLSGEIFTGRDAAHKRLIELLNAGKPLPLNLQNQVIYYVGPSPKKPHQAVGSAGPTTSYRMDKYTLPLLECGLKGMIGKGKRSLDVIEGMKKYKAVYFGATGGAAALIAQSITKSEVVLYEDLGTEAIHKFTVKDFPVVVLIDCLGQNLYEIGPALYKKEEM